MRWATRAAAVRIAVGLTALAGAWALVGRHQCRCPRAPAMMETNRVTISAEQLRSHVRKLADEIGERNVWRPGSLARAADYIESVWREQGWTVLRQTYDIGGVECANLEVALPGGDRAGEIVVVGAHYDTLPYSPGANDNASGVAALLEIARVIQPATPGAAASLAPSGAAPGRTIKFVAFVNEEPPFFQTARMGSRVYARRARERGENIRAMLSLETIGYYTDAPRSQRYPPLFRWFYPGRGNFLAFVSDLNSRPLLHEVVAAFRAHSRLPVECCATWGGVPGVGWSDHSSFWHEGYRAVMVTDTAPYRYPYYHTDQDTAEKLDYAGLTEATAGLAAAVARLAGRVP